MSDPNPASESPSEVERELPGMFLRTAREAQNLTLGEVAGALKFSIRQIEAIERNDFQLLQGKTFQRGFIRSYARMLKLSPEPLLDMLEAELQPVSEVIVPPDNMGETDPQPLYRRYGKALLVTFALLLVAAAVAYVYLEQHNRKVPVEEGVAQPAAVQATETERQTDSFSQEVDSLSAAAGPISGVAHPDVALSLIHGSPALTFEFSDRSWLEVKDATGSVLLTGEFPSGEKQITTGSPPYQIWIGKASAVKVSYGERQVDLLPHTREEVARLTLE